MEVSYTVWFLAYLEKLLDVYRITSIQGEFITLILLLQLYVWSIKAGSIQLSETVN